VNTEERDYVRYRAARVAESIEVARWAHEHGHLQDAVNRIYYACFYAVSALLYTHGLRSSKHSGIRALFAQHFIKTGALPRTMGRFYQDLFDHRQEGDYGDRAIFDPESVGKWICQAEEFIGTISIYLDKQIRDTAPGAD
jgi:uncharacterized protein (UPF0332 family)